MHSPSPHQRHPCRTSIYCPLILPQLLFFQRFTYLPSLSGWLWFVVFCFAFHCLNKKLKWHLSHSFTKTWLSYPVSTLLLLDYRLHFGRINRLVSTRVCNPTRPCDSSPILLFISECLVDPKERGLGCFVQALLCLSQPPTPTPAAAVLLFFGKWNMGWTRSGRLAVSAYMWQILG